MTPFPELIEKTRLDLFVIAEQCFEVQQSQGFIVDELRAQIAVAVDGDGKPRYSNEDKRKAALAEALIQTEVYQRLAVQLRGFEKEREFAAARLERLRGEFSLDKLQRREAITAADYM